MNDAMLKRCLLKVIWGNAILLLTVSGMIWIGGCITPAPIPPIPAPVTTTTTAGPVVTTTSYHRLRRWFEEFHRDLRVRQPPKGGEAK